MIEIKGTLNKHQTRALLSELVRLGSEPIVGMETEISGTMDRPVLVIRVSDPPQHGMRIFSFLRELTLHEGPKCG